MFSKKATVADQMRQQNKDLRKVHRDLERDRREIERQEKQIEIEIKKAAAKGDKMVCTTLAKQLLQLRKQKQRTYAAGSKVTSIGAQSKLMQSNVKLAGAMAATTKTMGAVNKEMKPEQIMKTMQEFEKENAKMEMKEELMDDSLNGILDESGDEDEQESIVNQVLDEIGIEMSGKVSNAPSALRDKLGEGSSKSKTMTTDEEIERQLAQLRTS